MLSCGMWLFAAEEPSREVLWQVSPIAALFEGGYDGWVSVAELKTHGDFGSGTFDKLDGEMIVLKGTVYQVRGDGSVVRAKDDVLTPFAEVTFFDADRTQTIAEITDFAQLEKALDTAYPENNMPVAFKLHGYFLYVKTRSVLAQKKPYPRLAEVVKNQPVFERQDCAGTIVGFRLPSYFQGMAVPGYHFHFISDDKKFGGHLLDASAEYLNVVADDTPTFSLALPINKPFNALKLNPASPAEITAAEK